MFYKDKVVLVTGGTGFIGTHIVQELLKHGADVRVPIHRRRLIISDDHIETIQADLTKLEDCERAVRGVDYIFHAAGAVGAAGVGKSAMMDGITQNLILTTRMLQAAWSENVKRFLLFSSSTGYPPAEHPVKEDELWSGQPHPSYLGYGWMRRYFEKLGEYVSSSSQVKIALVRPTAVYGRLDNIDPATCHVIPALIRRAVEKRDPFEVWGTGDEVRDFLHVTDLARGCLLMLEKYATSDSVNIGYGKGVKIKEIVEIILKAADHEKAEVIFNSSKPTNLPIRMVDTSKAKKVLGFEPRISLKEGLNNTVEWIKQEIKPCP